MAITRLGLGGPSRAYGAFSAKSPGISFPALSALELMAGSAVVAALDAGTDRTASLSAGVDITAALGMGLDTP